jgi:hypothetical protein
MMMRVVYLLFALTILLSCKSEDDAQQQHKDSKTQNEEQNIGANKASHENEATHSSEKDTLAAPAVFTNRGFDQALKYELLIESRICNPKFNDSINDGSVPCSAKFFRFFEYNRKRTLEDAFMLQVKAGVNNFPYRRLLIFERERGKLVLVNGITGYLVSQVKKENDFDDLIVAVIDDLGNNNFDRYDVLLRYKDGKYRMVEALGDLQGEFKNEQLKERATKAIEARIKEKNLIF